MSNWRGSTGGGVVEGLFNIVGLLVAAGFGPTAAVVIAILAVVLVAGSGYLLRTWWATVGDQPLELRIKAGNSRIKFVRKP